MRSHFTFPLVIICATTIYSCKKSGTAAPNQQTISASIVGKWITSKVEQKIYDPSGKLVADVMIDTVANYGYEQFNANGNVYDISTMNNTIDTLGINSYKITDNTLIYDPGTSNPVSVTIVELNQQTLEVEFQYTITGTDVQILQNNLNGALVYTVKTYQYSSRE